MLDILGLDIKHLSIYCNLKHKSCTPPPNNPKKTITTTKRTKTVNALREVLPVNVHNIPHYIHVISECTPSDAVSNLCDRFRWMLVKGALRGESGLGLTQAASTRSPAGRKQPCSLWSCCLSGPPTLTSKKIISHHCHLLTIFTHDSLSQLWGLYYVTRYNICWEIDWEITKKRSNFTAAWASVSKMK